MRIISKFQDYYDGVQAYGQDQELVYVREPKDYECRDTFSLHFRSKNVPLTALDKATRVESELPSERHFENKSLRWTINYYLLGFCGTWHVVGVAEDDGYGKDKKVKYFYSPNDVETWVKEVNWDSINKFFYKGQYGRSSYWSKAHGEKKDLKHIFSKAKDLTDELFRQFHSPVIIFKETGDTIDRKTVARANGCLKDYGFAKAKDPYTCFQEISMYLSGVLGVGEPDTIEISDIDMRDKKGFNNWSFKTMPGTKKPRRKGK